MLLGVSRSLSIRGSPISLLFFFNDTATTEIYTLSLHDALPILDDRQGRVGVAQEVAGIAGLLVVPLDAVEGQRVDRKSTRLNSSHQIISYAVFCLKKKKSRTRLPLRPAPSPCPAAPHRPDFRSE